jgi:c-di-AMP phosphodiesterase-like protein
MLLRWIREYGKQAGGFFIAFGIVLLIVIFILIVIGKSPDISFVGIMFALFSVGLALIAISLSLHSDERMTAMANLEFYEKMAMVQQYIMDMSKNEPDEWNKAYADKIFYDLKGAKQLEKWVKDPNIAKMFNDEIQILIDKALAGQKHEHLIKRLQEAKEDC